MSNKSAVAELETQNYRLPRTVVPSKYEIHLEPDLTTFKFEGSVVIHVGVHQPVKDIVLNAIELQLHTAEISNAKGTKYGASGITYDETEERATFSFPQSIEPGDWQLHIKFTGTLNDKLRGFYRSTYKDKNGEQKVLATTQLQATHARRAFPCWDEPDFKATYKPTLVVDERLTAISNASIESEKKLPNGKKEVVFKETIKMSTYLVAFIVGEFESTQPVMADGKPIRIYAPPGKGHLSKFSEGIAHHSLTYFAKYYGVPYPGDKLDLIAIPDFAFGAMENLGCVTFRETALLVDDKTSTHAEQERVADVVAHEIAHMWFGDLTTMGWWNGIWLNEAFATFAEMLAVDTWKPEWKRWESFGVSRAAALVVDGLKSTRPIEFPVRRPEECESMFDILTYEKGASVLRMLEQYLGQPVFQKGISIYLNRHQFANTETSDLWAALEEASEQPVVQLMDSWIFHPGYPMVSVEQDADGKSVKLSQQRFSYISDAEGAKQLFHVPVLLRARVNGKIVTHKVLLKDQSTTVDLGGNIEWIVANEGGHGFYRVRYSANLLQALTADVFNILSPIERFNLVNDTWAAVVAGHVPLDQYLHMAALFTDETDKNVWSVLSGSLLYIDRLVPESARTSFEAYVRGLAEPAHKKLGWEPKKGEDELAGQLRGLLISLLGIVGNDVQIQAKAVDLYAKYKADNKAVGPDIVPAIVAILAYTGDKARYDEFVQNFKSARTPQEEERFLYSLAGFRHEDLIKQTLERCLNGEVRTQNAPYLIRLVLMNDKARQLAWNFVKTNWEAIHSKYPDNSIPRMLEGITTMADAAMEKDVVEFIKKNPVRAGAKTVDQHMERLHVSVLFKEREAKALSSGFSR
jgi:puromycin-sensitive aminopeptidase